MLLLLFIFVCSLIFVLGLNKVKEEEKTVWAAAILERGENQANL